jgi:hypothetical protein
LELLDYQRRGEERVAGEAVLAWSHYCANEREELFQYSRFR